MKKSYYIINMILLIAMLPSCGNVKEVTEIKPHIIHPAVIEDSLMATVKTDTVIIGVSVIKKDTVTVVKYFPKLEKFYIKAKPDSIILLDTVRTVKTIEKFIETPLLSKIGLVFIGMLIVVAGYFIIKR